MVEIVFFKGFSWAGLFIKLFSRGKYSHVAFKIDGQRIDINAFRKVRSIPFDYKPHEYDVIEVDLTEDELLKLNHFINMNRRIKYDYNELIRFFFQNIPDIKDRYNCVEFIVDGLKFINKIDLDNKSYSPSELYDILKEKEL